MGPIAPLLAVARVMAGDALRRRMQSLALALVAGLFLLIAVAFALVALWFRLAIFHGPIAASLWIAGGATVIAALFLIISLVLRNSRSAQLPLDKALQLLESEAATLTADAKETVRDAPLTTVGGAFAIGLLLARLIR